MQYKSVFITLISTSGACPTRDHSWFSYPLFWSALDLNWLTTVVFRGRSKLIFVAKNGLFAHFWPVSFMVENVFYFRSFSCGQPLVLLLWTVTISVLIMEHSYVQIVKHFRSFSCGQPLFCSGPTRDHSWFSYPLFWSALDLNWLTTVVFRGRPKLIFVAKNGLFAHFWPVSFMVKNVFYFRSFSCGQPLVLLLLTVTISVLIMEHSYVQIVKWFQKSTP